MKNIFSKIIMCIILFLIFAVIICFGKIIGTELLSMRTMAEPEEIKTVISSSEQNEKNITTPHIIGDSISDSIIDENSNKSNSNTEANKYYYNQLNDYSKTIYQTFENNKENMKTGTYNVQLGDSYTNLLNSQNGQDELGQYYQSAIEAYTYDNPDVFYLNPNKMYLNIETTTKGTKTTYNVYVNSGNESNYLINEFSSKEQVDEALSKVQNVKNIVMQYKKDNTYDNIKLIHDFLLDYMEYDTSISKENIYNIYGALVNKEAVCEGYARSFKYLMDAYGIPCTVVIGVGRNSSGDTENHAWNYVQLNEKWYAIDTTWDDPIGNGNWINSSTRYKYFLKGSNDMDIDHTPSGRFTEKGKVFKYPNLNISNYK